MVNVGELFAERYRIEALLGEGGMGRVYRAYDVRLRRYVALKSLRVDRWHDPDVRASDGEARLLREAQSAASLHHRNVVAIHDVGKSGDVSYIVMELVDGRPLRTFIQDARVGIADRVRWLADVARALAAAHARGLIHRDVKPDNVMIANDGTVKVLDFGIAKQLDGPSSRMPTADAPASNLTREGHVLGTPRFMSPEQLSGAPIDARSDQFSWGLLAYELVSGTNPWATIDPRRATSLVEAIKNLHPRPLGEITPSTPPIVQQVIERALAKDPSHRFATMDEIAARLDAALAQLAPASAMAPTHPGPPVSAPPSYAPSSPPAASTTGGLVLSPSAAPPTSLPTLASPRAAHPSAAPHLVSASATGARGSNALLVGCLVAGIAMLGIGGAGVALLVWRANAEAPAASAPVDAPIPPPAAAGGGGAVDGGVDAAKLSTAAAKARGDAGAPAPAMVDAAAPPVDAAAPPRPTAKGCSVTADCGKFEVCNDGACACDSTHRRCGTECVNTWDPNHCGACGHACAAKEVCRADQCQACPSGYSRCGLSCATLDADEKNCGQCGHACSATEYCSGGLCRK